MTAPDRNRHHANLALDAGAPSTHDPKRKRTGLNGSAAHAGRVIGWKHCTEL